MSSKDTQIATKSDMQKWLESDKLRTQITQAMPKHGTPDRWMRVLFTAMQKTPALMQCSQSSLFQSFMDLSATGLEPDGRRAHIIPYRNRNGGYDAQLIIDYKGLVELVMNSGDVSRIYCDVVCEHDEYEEEMGEVTKHKIDRRKPRGEMYAAYARIYLKDGTKRDEIMSKEEIDAIRDRSKAGKNGPWVTDYNEMAKKTVFRRATKWCKLGSRVLETIERDDTQFPEIPNIDIVDVTPNAKAEEPAVDESTTPPKVEGDPMAVIEGLLLDNNLSESDLIKAAKEQGLAAKSAKGLGDIPVPKLQRIIESWDSMFGTVEM
jgi:recombination protein RecT